MDDFDLDLIDELCSSFCTPCTSQNTNDKMSKSRYESPLLSNRKRTSTMNPPENSIVKKVCLADLTNRSTIYEIDEDNILDESAVQLLVTEILLMDYQRFRRYFSAKNGKHHHNFHHYWIELLLCWRNIEIFDRCIVNRLSIWNCSHRTSFI